MYFDILEHMWYFCLKGTEGFNKMMQTQDIIETTGDKTAPQTGSMFLRGMKPAGGGVDYTKELEITQDEMTDELFAAMKRGDDDMVLGITTGVGRRAHSAMGMGAQLLTSHAQETKTRNDRTRSRRSRFGNPFGSGQLAALLAMTNGNEELAQLLLAKLNANTLLVMDGVYADDIAREMGVHGLSENIRQIQREETVRQNEAAEIATKPGVLSGMWNSLFVTQPKDEPEMFSLGGESNPGMLGRWGRSISCLFRSKARRQEEAAAPNMLVALATHKFSMPAPV